MSTEVTVEDGLYSSKRRRVSISFDGVESMTKQDSANESDINKIMAKYRKTGRITHLTSRQPLYGDFSTFQGLQHALETVDALTDEFMALDATIRKAADNDPARYYEMLASEEGVAALQAAGLNFEGQVPEAPPEPPPATPNPGDSPPAEVQ